MTWCTFETWHSSSPPPDWLNPHEQNNLREQRVVELHMFCKRIQHFFSKTLVSLDAQCKRCHNGCQPSNGAKNCYNIDWHETMVVFLQQEHGCSFCNVTQTFSQEVLKQNLSKLLHWHKTFFSSDFWLNCWNELVQGKRPTCVNWNKT